MFDNKSIEKIKEKLIERNEKLSIAESVTAGFLQAAMASAEVALKFFEGGITTYNINQKVKHLKVDKNNAEECNCVSEQTANEMASGVCALFGTDWGIAVTGYRSRVIQARWSFYNFIIVGSSSYSNPGDFLDRSCAACGDLHCNGNYTSA